MTVIDEAKLAPAPSLKERTANNAANLQDADTMRLLRRRTVILLLVLAPFMALTSYLVYTGSHRKPTPDIADIFPRTINSGGHFFNAGTDGSLTELELQILENPKYLLREYTDFDPTAALNVPPVGLCVVYSQDNRKGTHPPEVCLEGGGVHIEYKNDRKVVVDPTTNPPTEVTVRELVTQSAQGNDQSGNVYYCYFYKCGERYTPSFYVQQFWIILNGLKQRDASGALIRYHTAMGAMDHLGAARQRADALIRATFPYVKQLGS